MRWLIPFYRGTPIHILIGFFVGMFYVWFISDNDVAAALKEVASTLLTVFATLLAAGAAIATAIWDSERRRLASLRASKAMLPVALSNVVDVCDKAIDHYVKDEADPSYLKNVDHQQKALRDITLSPEVFNVLRDCIETSDETQAQWLGHLPSHFQVYRARFIGYLEGKPDDLAAKYTRASRMSDWILLKALASHLFDYARGAEEVDDALRPHDIFPNIELWFRTDVGSTFRDAVLNQLNSAREYYAPLTVDKFFLVRDQHFPQEEE